MVIAVTLEASSSLFKVEISSVAITFMQWRNATAGGRPSIGHFWPPFAPLKIG
jgi:hypothetical protein